MRWQEVGLPGAPKPRFLVCDGLGYPRGSVILSGGGVREASDAAVEGPRCCWFNREASGNSHSQCCGQSGEDAIPHHRGAIIAWSFDSADSPLRGESAALRMTLLSDCWGGRGLVRPRLLRLILVCYGLGHPRRSVILSGGGVREATDAVVEGPRCCQFNREASGNSHSQSCGQPGENAFSHHRAAIIAWSFDSADSPLRGESAALRMTLGAGAVSLHHYPHFLLIVGTDKTGIAVTPLPLRLCAVVARGSSRCPSR